MTSSFSEVGLIMVNAEWVTGIFFGFSEVFRSLKKACSGITTISAVLTGVFRQGKIISRDFMQLCCITQILSRL